MFSKSKFQIQILSSITRHFLFKISNKQEGLEMSLRKAQEYLDCLNEKKLFLSSEHTSETDFYVNKMDQLCSLLRDNQCISVFRPRRMGKSTMLNDLGYMYSAGNFLCLMYILKKFKITGSKALKEKFQKSPHPKFKDYHFKIDWNPMTVIKLDFSKVSWNKERSEYEKEINLDLFDQFRSDEQMREEMKTLGFKSSCSSFLKKGFNKQNKFVLLIDEYDNPLNTYFFDTKKYSELQTFYEEFFETIKSLAGDQFIYKSVITGILRFSQIGCDYEYNNYKSTLIHI